MNESPLDVEDDSDFTMDRWQEKSMKNTKNDTKEQKKKKNRLK